MTGDYYMVNQILSKGLHSADQACLQYTTTLMDKLEKVRSPVAVS
jgi:vacuolar protein sorting-associated protein VTA1